MKDHGFKLQLLLNFFTKLQNDILLDEGSDWIGLVVLVLVVVRSEENGSEGSEDGLEVDASVGVRLGRKPGLVCVFVY